jgi:hypothetical protein
LSLQSPLLRWRRAPHLHEAAVAMAAVATAAAVMAAVAMEAVTAADMEAATSMAAGTFTAAAVTLRMLISAEGRPGTEAGETFIRPGSVPVMSETR